MVCFGCKEPVTLGSRYTYPCIIKGKRVYLCARCIY